MKTINVIVKDMKNNVKVITTDCGRTVITKHSDSYIVNAVIEISEGNLIVLRHEGSFTLNIGRNNDMSFRQAENHIKKIFLGVENSL